MNTSVFGTNDVFPTPRLDDLTFQQLVDRARILIPRYCPEWTDHNLSDPGITLLELFAHLVDGMLYRVNQVPDRMHVKFLETIGIHLEPPVPASTEITFHLAKPVTEPIRLERGTEVGTRRTELEPATVFTLTDPLLLQAPRPFALLSTVVPSGGAAEGKPAIRWRRDVLPDIAGQMISLFTEDRQPAPGDAFVISFENTLARHLVRFEFACDPERAGGLNPDDPPLEWVVVGDGREADARCEVLENTTRGFTQNGFVRLLIPEMNRQRVAGLDAFWLKCRIVQKRGSEYRSSPRVRILRIETTGGVMTATHATTIRDELLGRSDGSPGQEFQLLYRPIVDARLPEETLLVEPPDGDVETWTEVRDFSCSMPDDPHYILDSTTGRLVLGPSIVQPDGKVCQLGRVPARGAVLRFSRYRHGGGASGNVMAGKLCVLKSSLPHITRVENRRDATGGRNGETIEHAKLRAAQMLRARDRAVTADDYVYLAERVEGVARACCTGIGPVEDQARYDCRPGLVRARILPRLTVHQQESELPQLLRSPAFELLQRTVMDDLRARSTVGVQVDVAAPLLVTVHIEVRLHLRAPGSQRDFAGEELKQELETHLRRFLSPYTGGPDGNGWPFGRSVSVPELRGVAERVNGIDFAEVDLKVATPPEPGMVGHSPQRRIDIVGWALPIVGRIQISINR